MCEVISYCGFDLHFLDMISNDGHLFIYLLTICVLSLG